MLEITKENYKSEVESSDIPVFIDFWAAWCGPCKTLGPIFEEVSSSYAGKVKFVKLDVDNNKEIAGQFGVMSIPTLIFVKSGKEVDRTVGSMSADKLKAFVDKNL
jgi:thioredoxin 1